MSSKGSLLAARWPIIAFFLVLAAVAATQSWRSVQVLPMHWDIDLMEGEQAFASLRFAHGGPIYVRPDQPPYTVLLYGPLFYVSLGAIEDVAKPPSFAKFVFEGRIFIFLCYLLIAIAAWRFALRFCKQPWLCLAAPLFILANISFYPYAATLRPDIPALLCSLLGFLVITGKDRPSWKRILGAGMLMGMGFLFKQSFLAAPAAAFFWLLWKRRYRSAIGLTAASLLPVVGLIGWLELHGDPVLYSLLLPRYTLYDIAGELRILGNAALGFPVIVLCVVLGLVGVWSRWRSDKERVRPVLFYLAFATLATGMAMAQVGGARYYLAETSTICAILAPAGLELWMERLAAHAPEMRLAAALVLVGVPSVNLVALRLVRKEPRYRPLASLLAGHRLLSTVPYVAAQGKDPEIVNPWTNSLLERVGRWSPAPILRQVRAREFDYVVLATQDSGKRRGQFPSHWRGIPALSPSIFREVEQNYRLAGTCKEGTVAILVPRQDPRGSELADRLAATCGWQKATSLAGHQFAGAAASHGATEEHPNAARPDNKP